MKTILTFIALLWLGNPCTAQLTWAERSQTFDIWACSTVTHLHFTLRNQGNIDAVIRSIYSTCDCTTVSVSESKIGRGETATVDALLDTRAIGFGPHHFSIVAEAELMPPAVLSITLGIKDPFLIPSRAVVWRVGEENSPKHLIIGAANGRELLSLQPLEKPNDISLRVNKQGDKWEVILAPLKTDTVLVKSIHYEALFSDGLVAQFGISLAVVRTHSPEAIAK